MRTKNESFSGEGGQMQRGTRDPKFSKYLESLCLRCLIAIRKESPRAIVMMVSTSKRDMDVRRVSRSGHLVLLMRLRNSVSSVSGTVTFGNGRIALLPVASVLLSCPTMFAVMDSPSSVMWQGQTGFRSRE